MKKNLFLILLIISSTSCKLKQNETQNQDKEAIVIGGLSTDKPRNFSASELEIGNRICANLKRKRLLFEKLENNTEKFRFKGDVTECDGSIFFNNEFDATLSFLGPEAEYSASRDTKNYFNIVATEQVGAMRSMCDMLSKNESVPNIIFDSNLKYAIKFLMADGFDNYQIIMSRKNSTGGYDPVSGESVSIFGQKSPGPTKFYGVEKERYRNILCEGKKVKTVKQTWVSALTPFEIK